MEPHEGPWSRPPEPPPAPPRRPPLGLFIWLGLLALVGLAVWLMARAYPGRVSGMDWADAFRAFTILALVSSGVVYARRVNLGQTLRQIALWAVVVSVLAVGYAFRGELAETGSRLRAELAPGSAIKDDAHEMVLVQGAGGQFYVMGKVNGAPVRFVIDTGASDIVLSPDDARRVGLNLAGLDFGRSYETANGIGSGAKATVGALEVGAARFRDVEVSVNAAPMSASLLGMSFLRRLDSFEVRGNRLVLRWRGA